MHIRGFAILSWTALGSAAYIKREPQETKPSAPFNPTQVAHIMEQLAPNIKAVSTTAKPQLRSDAARKILRFGPHYIPASKV
jgi:hypothetical protein